MSRSHLVPKRITRIDGVETTVWVKPSDAVDTSVKIPSPPPTSASQLGDRPIGDYLEDALTPEEIGLEDMGLNLINISPSYDNDEKVVVSAEGELSYDFFARHDLPQYSEEEALELFERIPVEDLNQLFSYRYPEVFVQDTGGDFPEITFSIEVEDTDSIAEVSDSLWKNTGLVQYVNETDPGTFGSRYIGSAIAELALINSGGEYRDLSEWDALSFPTNEDKEAAEQWAKDVGEGYPSPSAWEIAQQNQLMRADEKGITIPADYERGISDYHERQINRAKEVVVDYRKALDVFEKDGEEGVRREDPRLHSYLERLQGDDLGHKLRSAISDLDSRIKAKKAPLAEQPEYLKETVYSNIREGVDQDRTARKVELFESWKD